MESNFKKLSKKLSKEKGVYNPDGLAAHIGDEKYGKEGMAKKAKRAKKAPAMPKTSMPKKRK